MADKETHDSPTARVLNLVSVVTGLATGLFLMLLAYNTALGGLAVAVYGLVGVIGGYLGTWLLLIAAVILLSVASGVALGLLLLLGLLCFLTVILALFG